MDWHSRFLQQAAWTRDLRFTLFECAGLSHSRRVLEVGCGTGAILSELATPAAVFGLDLEFARLIDARMHVSSAALICGNALALPYPSEVFDITLCHFLLLWVRDPLKALIEMKRVTCPGGAVLALAEPDYNSRVDKPNTLAPLGHWQTESLQKQGADPGLGIRLADLFRQAGIQPIEAGALRQGTTRLPTPAERNMEWAVIEADLADMIPTEEMRRMKLLDDQAWKRSERVLYVPTYFAWGKV